VSGREAGRGASPAADPDAVELAPGTAHPKLEGSVAALAGEDELRAALEQAFDYRGDVRITRQDGSQVEGYIFDRRPGNSLADSYVRLLPKDGGGKISVSYLDVAGLAFSGRDMAAGKNWETWVRNYWERKAAGETNISLQPEKLE
jgi:hypothetical protein